MKTILTILLFLSSSLSFGQDPIAAIENIEENILFRGYPNKIRINTHPNDGCSYALTGVNAAIYKKGDLYEVKPGNGKTATLMVSEKKEDGATVLIREKTYRVSNLPDPRLKWGWTSSGRAVLNQKPVLSCGYVPYFQLDVDFTVESWMAEYEGKTYSGEGTDISELDDLIKTFTELRELSITAKVKGPDGITRQLGGTWFIRPTAKEED